MFFALIQAFETSHFCKVFMKRNKIRHTYLKCDFFRSLFPQWDGYLINLGKLHSRILNFARLKFSPSLAVFKFFCNSPQRLLHDCLNGARMRNCRLTNSQYSAKYCSKNAKSTAAAQTFHSHCSIRSFSLKFRPKAKKLITVFSGA